MPTRFSERDSTQRMGRSSLRASTVTICDSADQCLAPNDPPTSRRDHAQLVHRDAERVGHEHARHVRHLAPEVHGDLVAEAVVAGNHGDRGTFHRHDRDALVLDAGAHHDVGARERVGPGRLAQPEHARWCRCSRTRAGRRAPWPRRRRSIDGQRVVVDDDRLGRVDRLRPRLRHDDRDDVADEAHLVLGERRARRVGPQVHEQEVVGHLEIGCAVHGDHARHRRAPRRCRPRPSRACAIGDRTNATSSMPGTLRLSM